MGDSHDIRFIGGLSLYIPFTFSSLTVSNFALCCMPFLAGFYSKDYILKMFHTHQTFSNRSPAA